MSDYITIDNITYAVQYSIIPEEAQVLNYGDGSGYPGDEKLIDLEYVFIISGDNVGCQVEDDDILDVIKRELIDC